MDMGRRQFVTGAAFAGVAAAAFALTGCNPAPQMKASADEADASLPKPQATDYEISETRDADIVVVGGAGGGVEGIFACKSPLQKELGIAIEEVDILNTELDKSRYAISGIAWNDLIHKSGENIQWLLDNGVEFEGTVDGYTPQGELHTFHWFKDGHARDGYVDQMEAAAVKNGAEFLLNTAAEHVVMEDGRVAGLVAKQGDGSYIRINTNAVVLCAGGFSGNEDLLSEQLNLAPGEVSEASLESAKVAHRLGDGVNMAVESGAKRYPHSCMEGAINPENLPVGTSAQQFTLMLTDKMNWRNARKPLTKENFATVMVQEDGLRYVNEALCAVVHDEIYYASRRFCKAQYMIFDQNYVDNHINSDADMAEAFAAYLDQYPDCTLVADSIQELAELKGFDPAVLAGTIETYNKFCESGKDEEYGKPAEYLEKVDKAPFYITKLVIQPNATIGGVCIDGRNNALTPAKEAIPGLYVAGVDGCMLYSSTYTISVPGSACANSVNSGRNAVRNAIEYISSL